MSAKRGFDIHNLAAGAFTDSGQVKSYEEQLTAFAFGKMPSSDQFLLALKTKEMGLDECPDVPLLMKQSVVTKVTSTHELTLDQLKNLPLWLKNHPLALDSLEDIESIVVVTDAVDAEGRDIIIAVHLEKEYRSVTVNAIASIYGKKNLSYLIKNTLKAEKNVYINERTGDWIRRTGVQFPERIANHLQNQVYPIAINKHGIVTNQEADDRISRTGVQFPERIQNRLQEILYQYLDEEPGNARGETQGTPETGPAKTKDRNMGQEIDTSVKSASAQGQTETRNHKPPEK